MPVVQYGESDILLGVFVLFRVGYDMLARQDDNFAIDIMPVQCAHERLLTPIADKLAEELYNQDSALFLHKHYNEMFPFLSVLEEGIQLIQ
jgi:hypothetical protein